MGRQVSETLQACLIGLGISVSFQAVWFLILFKVLLPRDRR